MRLTTPPLPPLPSLPLSPCSSGHLPGASGETEWPTGARGPWRGRRWGRADRGQLEPTPDCHDSYRTCPEGSGGGGGRGDRTAAAVGHTQAPHHLQVLLCLLPEPLELHSSWGGGGGKSWYGEQGHHPKHRAATNTHTSHTIPHPNTLIT